MVASTLHVLYTPSENELDPGHYHREWWPCASFSCLFSLRLKGSLEMGSCEDRWKILRENTVRFLVNAPADFWSRDPPPDYTQTEKKRKETRTRGKKRKEKSRIIYMLRIFLFSPLRNLFWKFCDRREKTDRPSWHLVWRCRLCFIYFVASSIQTAGSDGQQGHKIT
jgi:hypothetical protein